MHVVREVLSMGCLCHWGTAVIAHTSCWALDARISRSHSCHSSDASWVATTWLRWTAVVHPISVTWGVAITVLHRVWRVHAHEVAQVRIVSLPTVSTGVLSSNAHCWVIRGIRSSLWRSWVVWDVAWVVWVARRLSSMARVLRIIQVASIWRLRSAASCAWHVSLFSGLRANASKPTKSWASLVVVVVAYRLTISIDSSVVAWVGIQVIVIRVVVIIVVVRISSMIMVSNISLTELVQNWSGPFGVNSRYLSHYLSIVSMITIIILLSLRLFNWTNFRGTSSFIVVVIPIFSSISFVSIIVASQTWIAMNTVLLIVRYSILFKKHIEESQPVSVISKKSISSELPHFSLSHYFDFLHLGWSKLDLSWVDGAGSSKIRVVGLFSWIEVTVIVVVVHLRRILFRISGLSVLLSDSCLELMDSTLFKFLTHDFFFTEPWVSILSILIHVGLASCRSWWRLTFTFLSSLLCIRSTQFE